MGWLLSMDLSFAGLHCWEDPSSQLRLSTFWTWKAYHAIVIDAARSSSCGVLVGCTCFFKPGTIQLAILVSKAPPYLFALLLFLSSCYFSLDCFAYLWSTWSAVLVWQQFCIYRSIFVSPYKLCHSWWSPSKWDFFWLIRSEFVIRITGLEQDRKSSRERLHLEDAECQVANRDFGLGRLALSLSGLYHVFARDDIMRK